MLVDNRLTVTCQHNVYVSKANNLKMYQKRCVQQTEESICDTVLQESTKIWPFMPQKAGYKLVTEEDFQGAIGVGSPSQKEKK